MNRIFFTPGPSELYFTVPDHLRSALKENIGSISHRSSAFQKIYKNCIEELEKLLNIPSDFEILFASSATEIWERSLQNLVSEKADFFVNGSFSEKFYHTGEALLKHTTRHDAENYTWNNKFSKIDYATEFIAIAANETSIGMCTGMNEISTIKKAHPDKVLAIDVVSAIPYYEIDFAHCDMAYFSVQKGFGLPAGLGVWILKKSLIEVAAKKGLEDHISPHRRLSEMHKMAVKNQTTETPNVMAIYLLGKVCEDMNRRGIDQIRIETNYKAAVLNQAIEQSSLLDFLIQEERYRSKTTIVAACKGIEAQSIIDHLKNFGMIIGSGYGNNKNKHIRIANFPAHSKESIEQLADELLNYRK
jgi:phosphoserine aminotransferase